MNLVFVADSCTGFCSGLLWKHELNLKDPLELFCKKRCSENFCKFHRKTFVLKFFLIELLVFRPVTLWKRDSNTGAFLWNLQSFLRTLILSKICERLLLKPVLSPGVPFLITYGSNWFLCFSFCVCQFSLHYFWDCYCFLLNCAKFLRLPLHKDFCLLPHLWLLKCCKNKNSYGTKICFYSTKINLYSIKIFLILSLFLLISKYIFIQSK